MDQNVEFLIKISITIILSVFIFVGMIKLQRRKELEAEIKFQNTLKYKGLSSKLEEK